MASDSDPHPAKQNGRLSIPLPFETALKAATKVPADRLPPPNGKPKRKPRKPAKG